MMLEDDLQIMKDDLNAKAMEDYLKPMSTYEHCIAHIPWNEGTL